MQLTGKTACQGNANGLVEGRARVLRRVSDIDSLEAGDILICEMTTPEWTPAFGKVRGLITAVGGSLCHAAIVAREFGLPCAVSVNYALNIVDGTIVTLDVRERMARVLTREDRVGPAKAYATGDCPKCSVPRDGIIKHVCPKWAKAVSHA